MLICINGKEGWGDKTTLTETFNKRTFCLPLFPSWCFITDWLNLIDFCNLLMVGLGEKNI